MIREIKLKIKAKPNRKMKKKEDLVSKENKFLDSKNTKIPDTYHFHSLTQRSEPKPSSKKKKGKR